MQKLNFDKGSKSKFFFFLEGGGEGVVNEF